MKRLLLIVLLLFGCGEDFKVDISMTTIAWEGSLEKDPTMLQKFNETSACMADYGFHRTGYPYVIVTNSDFICNETLVSACVSFAANTIYIRGDYSCISDITSQWFDATCTDWALRHEIIHWITLRGNGSHNAPYFNSCSNI